jgi:hypothetical protein
MKIRYKGSVGDPAQNDHGTWHTGDVKDIPDDAAERYIATGCFEDASDRTATASEHES